MILIWGFKTYVAVLAMANIVCGRCQNPAAQQYLPPTPPPYGQTYGQTYAPPAQQQLAPPYQP